MISDYISFIAVKYNFLHLLLFISKTSKHFEVIIEYQLGTDFVCIRKSLQKSLKHGNILFYLV